MCVCVCVCMYVCICIYASMYRDNETFTPIKEVHYSLRH